MIARGAWRAALVAVVALAGCRGKDDAAARPGLGTQLYAGQVRALQASSDGAWIAFLEGCADVKGAQALPPGTASCELRLVSSSGGDAPRVASAVTTLPQGFAWSPRVAALAALADYDYVAGAGTLVLARPGAEAARVADGVTFVGFEPGGDRVAAIAGGRLLTAAPGSAPRWIDGAEGLTSFELHPAAAERGGERDVAALARRSAQAGGALLAVPARGGAPVQVAARTGDYRFAPDGRAYAFTVQGPDGYELRLAAGGAPARVGRRVHAFEFSGDGAAIAFVADSEPGRQGDLHVAPLGKPDALVGREVGEFRWAARTPRLAWLEAYDPRVRSGTLAVGGPGTAPRALARNVSDFDLAPDGKAVAFLQHTTRGGYSVDLAVARLDTPGTHGTETIARGVFGFAYAPDGAWLYYRTRCTRNADACDLERIAAGRGAGGKPEVVAQGVKSFEFDPRDAGRLLLTWQRMDLAALDVAVWEAGKLVRIDTAVRPGTARFLGPDSRRLAYAVQHPKRAGVYVATVPAADGPKAGSEAR